MSSLFFLLSRKLKNRVREMLHRPSELVVLILLAAMVAVTIFSGRVGEVNGFGLRNIE